jgi:hypothetical protein
VQSGCCAIAPRPRFGEAIALVLALLQLAQSVFNVHVGDLALLQHLSQHALPFLGSSPQGGDLRIALGQVPSKLLDKGHCARLPQRILYALVTGEV